MVIVIGAGPGGLAAAAAIQLIGARVRIVERADDVGASWRAHYDRLRLHTVRWLSALPGMAIPREYGSWVARDDVLRYLHDYAAHHALEIQLGVEVTRLERGWR